MPIYLIERMQFSLFNFQYYVRSFTILSEKFVVDIYYHIRRDHESSVFREVTDYKWCAEINVIIFFIENNLFSIFNYFLHCGATV